MAYYRFVSDQELQLINRNRAILPTGHFPPYQPNEVVCIFESEDLSALFTRYGPLLADMREIPVGGRLTILMIDASGLTIETDASQSGWPESRVVRGAIQVTRLRTAAEGIVVSNRAGNVVLNWA
jgi:hypothetical protein